MATSSQSRPRTQPRRKANARPSYNEPDSDSGLDDVPLHTVARRPRSSRHVRSYKEDSDESDGADSEDTTPTEAESSSADIQRKPEASPNSKNTVRRRALKRPATRQQQLKDFKRKKVGHARLANLKPSSFAPIIPPAKNGRMLPWQSLEYQIWQDIMRYAAYPLYDNAGRTHISVGWLLKMSRLCRKFHEAAISVLLSSPPLLPSYRAYGLLNLLLHDQDALSLNFSNKIHRLDVEVKQLLIRKSGVDLESLLKRTPLLKHLRIFHYHDDLISRYIWAKAVYGRDKWSYGNLFDVLDETGITLHSFEWNARFRDTTDALLASCQRPCLRRVYHLKLANFVFEDKEDQKRTEVRDSVAQALGLHQDLTLLEFWNCNILDADLMAKIPANLSTLVISHCQSLTSDALEAYLSVYGTSLKKLHLIGNQVMDLGFAPILKNACPNLQDLYIDLSYEDSSSYRDRDPLYDHLLPNGRPTWPNALQSLIVGPLRSLSVSDAEDFYQSLVDAAEDLPFLRVLSVKTLLKDASWRDRARLRSKWAGILNEVFLTTQKYVPVVSAPSTMKRSDNAKSSTRKSARILELGGSQSSESTPRKEPTFADLESDNFPRQKSCLVVEFDLSDQRPAQEQYREEDFLDEELSGDGAWRR